MQRKQLQVKGILSHCRSVDPQVSGRLSFPEFLDNRHMNLVSLSALRNGLLNPHEVSLVSYLLVNESNPGPQCGRRIKSMKNLNELTGIQTLDDPACSAAPEPTALPRTPQRNQSSLKERRRILFIYIYDLFINFGSS